MTPTFRDNSGSLPAYHQDMPPERSKGERRKEQNRRAQANYRQRKQQRFHSLQQRLCYLESVASSSSGASLLDVAGLGVAGAQQHVTPLDGPAQAVIEPASLPDLDHDPYNMFFDINNTNNPFPPAGHSYAPSAYDGVDWNAASRFDAAELQRPNLNSIPSGPRPYESTKKTQCYIFDALASNAGLLGYSKEALIKDTSSSRFFSPLSLNDHSALPKAFRPTVAQLTYQHHPYIDCIPLPDLRNRMILALSHKPPLICNLELFHDVLLGGLSTGPDPQDGSQWSMCEAFARKYENFVLFDLGTLWAQTLSSNPPLRIVFPTGEGHTSC